MAHQHQSAILLFLNQNTSQNIRRQGFWNFRIVSSVRIYIAEELVQDSRVPEDPPSYRQKPSTLKFSPKSTIPSRGAYHNNNLTDLRAGVPNGHPEEVGTRRDLYPRGVSFSTK
ncbi:hypothetical protein TNCV_1490021 [Trichonephila clavipes]|nr:hypothetical protein TNCV_1490021 [Trichonephila clavipes]